MNKPVNHDPMFGNVEPSTYRPLPDSLTIKDSGIEGLGLFAREDIPANTCLGISHINLPGNVTGDKWLRLPLGGFYNYSDYPNCKNKDLGTYLELHTIDDILEGEELTVTYMLYSIPKK